MRLVRGETWRRKFKYDEGIEGAADIPSVAEGRPESLPLVNNLHACKVCDFGTEELIELHFHLETVHQGEFWYCIQCRIYFAIREDLKHHVTVDHEGQGGKEYDWSISPEICRHGKCEGLLFNL